MITLYGMQDSGNCYKPRLLMALTGRPFRSIEVSTLDGSTRTERFLAKNPAGQAPVVQLEDARFLPESGAILCLLGEGTDFVPKDPFQKASMLRWMFFEQNTHEASIAVRRSLLVYPERRAAATPEQLAMTLSSGNAALSVMERHLAGKDFFVETGPSLADIALYAYTHVADEGGFDLGNYPAIQAWLARIAALPGFQPKSWAPNA